MQILEPTNSKSSLFLQIYQQMCWFIDLLIKNKKKMIIFKLRKFQKLNFLTFTDVKKLNKYFHFCLFFCLFVFLFLRPNFFFRTECKNFWLRPNCCTPRGQWQLLHGQQVPRKLRRDLWTAGRSASHEAYMWMEAVMRRKTTTTKQIKVCDYAAKPPGVKQPSWAKSHLSCTTNTHATYSAISELRTCGRYVCMKALKTRLGFYCTMVLINRSNSWINC